ncbi:MULTISPECIES: STAS domain-containing protein [unclassified Plantibacter]|uniref:STAS domain-containing protein n=1 Tax=unclassified Plantibacter TaxID=2624265 RepID=UPI003D336123
MAVTTEPIGDDVVAFRIDGRLNMVSAPDLRSAVNRALAGDRPKIVIDLSAVTFMDSAGLGVLIACLKTARQAGGDVRISAPSEQVAMVLSLSNVDQILTPFESAEAAYRD